MFRAVRIAAFVLSFFGYCLAVKKQGIRMAFAPAIVFSGIGTLMFLAGLINCLRLSAVLICLGGMLCLLYAKPWKERSVCSRTDWFWLTGFLALVGLFSVRLYGEIPTHYDAFSHWLTVVRELIMTDRFPSFRSELIDFQGYQTGAAALIYYFCKITGLFRDDMVLLAQTLPILAGVLAVAGFFRRFDLYAVAAAVCGMIYCLAAMPVGATAIAEPLPDLLLSMLSVSALAIIVYYREEPKKAMLASLPVQMFLVAVKNSGMLFMAFHTVLLLILWVLCDWKRMAAEGASLCGRIGQMLRIAMIHCGGPLLLFFFWGRHVDFAFESGMTTKHAMSLENFVSNFQKKGSGDLRELLHVFRLRCFSWNESWLLLLLLLAVLLTGYLVKRFFFQKKNIAEPLIALGTIGTYLAYMFGLLCMYVFSMPIDEALVLESYDRYEMTILICLVGGITIYLAHFLTSVPKGKLHALRSLMCLLLLAVLLPVQQRIPPLFIKTHGYEGSDRQFLEQIKEDYSIQNGEHCMLYGPQIDDTGYHYYLGRYVFWTDKIKTVSPRRVDELREIPDSFDYLIVMGSDPALEMLLAESGFPPGEAAYKLD